MKEDSSTPHVSMLAGVLNAKVRSPTGLCERKDPCHWSLAVGLSRGGLKCLEHAASLLRMSNGVSLGTGSDVEDNCNDAIALGILHAAREAVAFRPAMAFAGAVVEVLKNITECCIITRYLQ